MVTVWRSAGVPGLLWGLCYVVSGVAPAAQVSLTAVLLDHLSAKDPVVLPALGLAAAVLVAQSMFTFQPVLKTLCGLRLQEALDGEFLAHVAGLTLATREHPETEALVERVSGRGAAATDLLEICLGWLMSLCTICTLALVVGTVCWWLPPVLLIGGTPLAIVEGRRALARRALSLDQAADQRLLGHLSNLLSGRSAQEEVRVYGLTDHLLHHWQTLYLRLAAARRKLVVRQEACALPGRAATRALTWAGVAALVYSTSHRAVAPGHLVALIGGVVELIAAIGAGSHMVGAVVDGWERLRDAQRLLALPLTAPVAPPAETAGVTVDHVTFRYPGRAEPALTDVTFRIRRGEHVALVGPNGAGKSTLVKCMLGLYRPDTGRVALHGPAAPVFQDYLRPEFTAREAIGFGASAALHDDTRLRRAARDGSAAAFLEHLPHGYDTALGRALYDDGAELSGGQWQRVAVSRALFADPEIVVMDEPASALDPLAEADVFRRFADMARGRTAILVSHRLGMARLCDQVVVLDRGRVVETGPHDVLVARGGPYAAMWAAQAEWYR